MAGEGKFSSKNRRARGEHIYRRSEKRTVNFATSCKNFPEITKVRQIRDELVPVAERGDTNPDSCGW